MEEKKNNRIGILLIAIVALVIVAVVILAFISKNSSQQVQQNQTQNETASNPLSNLPSNCKASGGFAICIENYTVVRTLNEDGVIKSVTYTMISNNETAIYPVINIAVSDQESGFMDKILDLRELLQPNTKVTKTVYTNIQITNIDFKPVMTLTLFGHTTGKIVGINTTIDRIQ